MPFSCFARIVTPWCGRVLSFRSVTVMEGSNVPDTIWIFASDGDKAAVEACLAQGHTPNDMDEHGYTPMHAAASYNHVELLQFLVSRGGNVNLKDTDGETPLHVCEHVEAAQALISLGADATIKNNEGKVASEVAAEDGHFDVANYLRGLVGLPPVDPADYASEEEEEDGDEGNDSDDDGMDEQQPAE